jgi:hypothetical protein
VREPLDVEVVFTVPAESRARGFPALEGPGRARGGGGRLVLQGKVFRLTAWWLKVFAPLGLLAAGTLFLAFGDVGLWLGLGGTLALAGADFWQQRAGREYELEIPRPCAATLEIAAGRCVATIQLDQFLIGGGHRPPVVRMELDAAHAVEIERLLRA